MSLSSSRLQSLCKTRETICTPLHVRGGRCVSLKCNDWGGSWRRWTNIAASQERANFMSFQCGLLRHNGFRYVTRKRYGKNAELCRHAHSGHRRKVPSLLACSLAQQRNKAHVLGTRQGLRDRADGSVALSICLKRHETSIAGPSSSSCGEKTGVYV